MMNITHISVSNIEEGLLTRPSSSRMHNIIAHDSQDTTSYSMNSSVLSFHTSCLPSFYPRKHENDLWNILDNATNLPICAIESDGRYQCQPCISLNVSSIFEYVGYMYSLDMIKTTCVYDSVTTSCINLRERIVRQLCKKGSTTVATPIKYKLCIYRHSKVKYLWFANPDWLCQDMSAGSASGLQCLELRLKVLGCLWKVKSRLCHVYRRRVSLELWGWLLTYKVRDGRNFSLSRKEGAD